VSEHSLPFDQSLQSSASEPGRWPIVEAQILRLVRLSLFVWAVYIVSTTRVDPDLWGHVLFGRDIVTHGAIQTVDPYSFTSDRAWVNHEWLAEVLLYLAFAAGGSLGIVALKTGIVTGAFGLMLGAIKRAALKHVHQDKLMALAFVVILPRILPARPQVFSVLMFALLLHSLMAADRGNRRWLLVVPISMAVWANLHGGFIVGLGVLCMWLLVRLLQGQDAKSNAALVAVGLVSVAATLVNPYGFRLWQFLWSTVGLSRPGISDWQPMFSLPAITWVPFVIAAAVCMFMMLKAGARLDWAYRLIIAALFLGAMRVGRLNAFSAVAMVMLVAPSLNPSDGSVARDVFVVSAFRHCRVFLTVATVIVLAGVSYGLKSARCILVMGAPESAAIEFFKTHASRARVLTFFDWGEYAIWHLGPDILVSMDGRRETVYSEDLFNRHNELYQGKPDATAFVGRLAPDFVWLPSGFGVVETLIKAGWHTVFRGPVSTILAKDAGLPVWNQPSNGDANRCFPNP
jgi:hypothetical protein